MKYRVGRMCGETTYHDSRLEAMSEASAAWATGHYSRVTLHERVEFRSMNLDTDNAVWDLMREWERTGVTT